MSCAHVKILMTAEVTKSLTVEVMTDGARAATLTGHMHDGYTSPARYTVRCRSCGKVWRGARSELLAEEFTAAVYRAAAEGLGGDVEP